MIIGIGIDVVDIGRFARALTREPRLAERLFADCEREQKIESLAARFAAKEAAIKALGGVGDGFSWRDVIVQKNEVGAPQLVVTGTMSQRATALGVNRWHLSLSHDAGLAIAMVVAET